MSRNCPTPDELLAFTTGPIPSALGCLWANFFGDGRPFRTRDGVRAAYDEGGEICTRSQKLLATKGLVAITQPRPAVWTDIVRRFATIRLGRRSSALPSRWV
jgi:hypothetical protein